MAKYCQVAQRGWGVSLSWDIPNLPGDPLLCHLLKVNLPWHMLWTRWFGLDDFQHLVPSNTNDSVILWSFCNRERERERLNKLQLNCISKLKIKIISGIRNHRSNVSTFKNSNTFCSWNKGKKIQSKKLSLINNDSRVPIKSHLCVLKTRLHLVCLNVINEADYYK